MKILDLWSKKVKSLRYNMFCLPPAGSSANIYASWKKCALTYLNIIPIEYPGHGFKMNQPLIDNAELLAKNISNEIIQKSDHPFILFGHSVGGGLVLKIEAELKKQNKIDQLKMMVISSRPEHHYIQHLQYKHDISDQEIIARLKRYNHFPDEILKSPDALRFFLKIIRNDFYISDQLIKERIKKTTVPLMTFHGKDDPDIPDKSMMQAWQQHTDHWFESVELQGDHFYFLSAEIQTQLLEKIEHTIAKKFEYA